MNLDQKWITEESRLWNAVMNPGSPAVAKLARRVARLPPGKNKSKLQQQITKTRAREFAAGWDSFRSLVSH